MITMQSFVWWKEALRNYFEYRSFKSYEKKEFINDLKQVPLSVFQGVRDLDDTVFLWEKLFKDYADHHAPLKSRHVKGVPTLWVSDKLLEVRRDRDFHRRKELSSNSQYHWECITNWEILQIGRRDLSNHSTIVS